MHVNQLNQQKHVPLIKDSANKRTEEYVLYWMYVDAIKAC